MEQVAADWAAWDDTYRFVLDRNESYIESNFQWESLESAGINVLYLFDPDQNVVWGEAFSTAMGGPVNLDEGTLERFLRISGQIQQSSTHLPVKGLVTTPSGLLMMVAYPVLTSEKKGPIRGALIIGRFLGPTLQESIQQYTWVKFNLKKLSDTLPEEVVEWVQTGMDPDTKIYMAGEEWMWVYGILRSIDGLPIRLVEAVIHRDIMARGILSARWATLSILFILILTLISITLVAVSHLRALKKTNDRVMTLVEERTMELAQATDEAKRLQEEATKANQAKSEFLANISHEVRTPLNGIIGLAQMASDTVTDVNLRNILSTILREADFLIALINDTLDLSRIDAGRMVLDSYPFDCVQHMEDIACDVALRVEDRDIEVTCYVAPDVPRKALGDRRRLRQIILNLAYNALKFTERGEVNLRMERAPEASQRQCSSGECMLFFSVQDTGVGIPKAKQATIFDRFTQADNSLSKRYKGAGLGTYIAQELAHLMEGEIGLESEEGEGSRFWFTAKVKLDGQGTTAVDWRCSASGKRVLVLDSCTTTCRILKEYLEAFGVHATVCSEREEAFDLASHAMLEDQPFDLLLMDEKFLLQERPGELGSLPMVVLSRIGHTGVIDFIDPALDVKGLLIKPLRWALIKAVLMGSLEGRKLPRKGPGTRSDEPPKTAAHILLVEDYPTNQMVMMAHLQSAGHNVELAANGEEAIEKCRSRTFDLILMDLQMPGMDGYTATEVILKEGLSQAPIVAMSAHAMPEYREKCLAVGMSDFLAKPVKRHLMIEKLKQWLPETLTGYATGMAAEPPLNYTENEPPLAPSHSVQETPAVFDHGGALEDFLGNKALFMTALKRFMKDSQEQVSGLPRLEIEGQLETLRREAHKLKGGAASLAAYELSEGAARLEGLALASGDPSGADAISGAIQALNEAFQRFMSAANAWLAENESPENAPD